jgi:DNA polymerase III alpha subunit
MFGTIDFYMKAKDAGTKSIIGLEVYVAVAIAQRRSPTT